MTTELLELRLSEKITMRFRRIPAGRFRMGQRGEDANEEPVHWVEIPDAFWMAETPVTQAQFAVWKPEHENGFPNRAKNPAENMTWHEAVAYCEWLTGKFSKEIPVGMVARLPLESEWEYACRAGTTTEYHTGDGEKALAEAGWYEGNSGNETHPVGEKAANACGLRDMHGNVWEWCEDEWDEDAYKKRADGVVIARLEAESEAGGDQPRVLRGGSWGFTPRRCRAAFRCRVEPGYRNWLVGFRVCLVPGPQEFKTSQSGAGKRSRSAKDEHGGAAFPRSDQPGTTKQTAKRRKFFPKKTDTIP